MKMLFRFFRTVTALLLALCMLTLVACSNGTTPNGASPKPPASDTTSKGDDDTTPSQEEESDPESDPSPIVTPPPSPEPTPSDELTSGTMIYYENFNSYADTATNEATLTALRQNGIWKFDDQTDPYYAASAPYAATSTGNYTVENGKLVIRAHKDADGNDVSGTDTYLIIQDESYLWQLTGLDYTVQYDVSYESFANAKRYICLLWNYYGQYYNTFHLRANGTGNLQMHKAGNWVTMDAFEAGVDLYAAAVDSDSTGSSIAKKLLGIESNGSSSQSVFKDISVTVRIQIDADGASAVYLRVNGDAGLSQDFVKVSQYTAASAIGTELNPHLKQSNGGSLCLKTGAAINGTVDNIMVYVGHGEEPADKTVTFEPKELPDVSTTLSFTQTSVVTTLEYSDSAYTNYNAVADPTYLVPALEQGFIPQGLDVWEEKGWLLISGYFKDTLICPSSLIVAIDLSTGSFVGYYPIKSEEGTYYTGHAGGIAVTAKNVFLANGGNLMRIPLSQIIAAGNNGTLTICESIAVPVRASFCNYSAGVLWVGDFYHPSVASYATPEWRHLTNNAGGTYCAWTVGYRLADSDSEFTAENWDAATMDYATPDIVISMTERIQGFAVVGDYIALSQSYGRTNNSKILLYENVLDTTEHTSVTLNGESVPVWFLDSTLTNLSYTAMPMSEGLAAYNSKLLILYESGASYYKDDGGKNPTDRVWSMEMPA